MDSLSTPVIKRALRLGLIGGGVAVYCAAVGLVGRFESRDIITDFVALGRGLLFALVLAVGYMAARRPARKPGEAEAAPGAEGAGRVVAGAVAGGTTGVVVALLIVVGAAINLRLMFVSLSGALFEVLKFGQDTAPGALIWVLAGAVLGAAAGAAHLVPRRWRGPMFTALVAVLLLSLFSPLVRQIFISLEIPRDWLYQGSGMTPLGAVVLFVVIVAALELWSAKGDKPRRTFEALPDTQRSTAKWVGIAIALAFLLYLPQILGVFLSEVVGTVGLFILLGLGLNIVVGYAGLLDLGYVAFFAIGAYSTALLMSPSAAGGTEMSFWLAVPIVVIVSTVAGILIGAPVLRLRGDYLAIVTLGFGEIVRIIVISNWAAPFTGGAQGILGIPDPVLFGNEIKGSQALYYLIFVAVMLAFFISKRLQTSRMGRAWNAMREDEQVAEAMGLSIIKTKLSAFAMGAAIGCLAGAFFAVKIGSVFPHSFNILVSIQALSLIVLGGMGSIPGVIVGAAVLVGLPELLREFAEFRLLLYGAILVAIMIVKPEGLIPSARRKAELHLDETPDDQYEHRAGQEAGAPTITAAPGEAG